MSIRLGMTSEDALKLHGILCQATMSLWCTNDDRAFINPLVHQISAELAADRERQAEFEIRAHEKAVQILPFLLRAREEKTWISNHDGSQRRFQHQQRNWPRYLLRGYTSFENPRYTPVGIVLDKEQWDGYWVAAAHGMPALLADHGYTDLKLQMLVLERTPAAYFRPEGRVEPINPRPFSVVGYRLAPVDEPDSPDIRDVNW